MSLNADQRRHLLALARTSIEAALRRGAYVEPQLQDVPPALLELRACFVTLRIHGELRGCVGTLESNRPLAESVWRYAHAAAFADPRFDGISAEEWRPCDVHIAVLTPPEPIPVATEGELLAALRPGLDGLILEDGVARATFLPSVWEEIDDPATFVRQLKLKGGWRADYWSPRMRAWRYGSENFGETESLTAKNA